MSERIVLKPKSRHYDAVLLTVPHDKFLDMGEEVMKEFGKPNSLFFDLKSKFNPLASDFRL